MTTPFSDKVIILYDLYMNHHDDDAWSDFFMMEDLGIPLSVAIHLGGATPTEVGIKWIDETFSAFCSALGIQDTGFSTLDEMISNE